MTEGVIVFARMSSTRLPGKSLCMIGGRTLIGRVFDRSKAVGLEGPVVLATSDRPEDDCLVDVAQAEGVGVFRGSLDDVAGRALAAAQAFGLEAFARVCGDRPFFDPRLVADLAALRRRDDLDLATNAQRKTYPPGLTAEVIRTAALGQALAETDDPQDREHVTRYFYSAPDRFSIGNIASPVPLDPRVSLVIDTAEDYDRACFIAAGLGEGDTPSAPAERITALAVEWYECRTGSGTSC